MPKPPNLTFYNFLITEGAAMLFRQGQSRQAAEKAAEVFALNVVQKLGGTNLYLGMKRQEERQAKLVTVKGQIDENGVDIAALAGQHGLSTRQIYNIIKATRDITALKSQKTNKPLQLVAIEATRMFLKAGVQIEDAATAARGLLAILSARFGHTKIYVPQLTQLNTKRKHDEIFRQYQEGLSYEELAVKHNLTTRQVRIITAKYTERGSTGDSLIQLALIKRRILQVASNFSDKAVPAFTALHELSEKAEEIRQILQKGDEKAWEN